MRILNQEPAGYSPLARQILEGLGTVDDYDTGAEYDVIITRLKPVNISKHPKVIVTPTTGLNHIDLERAEKLGIAVLSLNGEVDFLNEIHATAEHTWALLLSLIRHIPEAQSSVKRGHWNRELYKGTELHGKTLLVIGHGRLGRKVAGFGRAFGMVVLTCDKGDIIPYEKADIISIHVSYDQYNLIDGEAFSRMKQGVIIVNTSRGEVIDQHELLQALKSGKVAGAALDVVEGDHIGYDPCLLEYLRSNDNLIITPHIGGATRESMEKTEVFMAKKLEGWHEHIRNNPG